jgi:hypothetical protein
MIESKEPYVFSAEKEQTPKKRKKKSSKYSVAGTQKAADHKSIASEEVVPVVEDAVRVEENEGAPAINVPDVRTVKCNYMLNVRKSPNGEILRTIPNGTKVEVVEELDHWCKLVDGTYVMKRFLEK